MSSSNVLHPVCIWTFFQATLVSIDGLRLCIRSTPMQLLKSILGIEICKSTFHLNIIVQFHEGYMEYRLPMEGSMMTRVKVDCTKSNIAEI